MLGTPKHCDIKMFIILQAFMLCLPSNDSQYRLDAVDLFVTCVLCVFRFNIGGKEILVR